MKEEDTDKYKKISPTQAIRKKCVDCCGGILNEIKACSVIKCELWRFRLGLHPFTEKNKNNPFLQSENFKGLQNKEAQEVIKQIGEIKNDGSVYTFTKTNKKRKETKHEKP